MTTLSDFALILISTIFVNNFVLVRFLGMCPFLGVTQKVENALGMSYAVVFVITLTAVLCWVVDHLILAPLGLGYLRILAFILIIAALVQLTETVIKKVSPVLFASLGIFLPLITTNCAVLGVPLLNLQKEYSFFESVVFGFGASVGSGMVMVLFASMRERIVDAEVPGMMKGSPVVLVTASLLSLAFMGFSGMVR